MSCTSMTTSDRRGESSSTHEPRCARTFASPLPLLRRGRGQADSHLGGVAPQVPGIMHGGRRWGPDGQ
eukprot:3299597-Alexandrium_andersonii.AAC.1